MKSLKCAIEQHEKNLTCSTFKTNREFKQTDMTSLYAPMYLREYSLNV